MDDITQPESLGGMTPEQFAEYQKLPPRDRAYYLRRNNITLTPKKRK